MSLRPETRERMFWQRVEKSDSCWLWRGSRNSYGYGSLHWDLARTSAHRVAYQLLVGPIPDGLVIDHLCRVRLCVNPSHLEVVTNGENVLRGFSPAAINARVKRCKRGHEFTPENTNIDGRGARICRACTSMKNRNYGSRRWLCPTCGSELSFSWRSKHIKLHKETR